MNKILCAIALGLSIFSPVTAQQNKQAKPPVYVIKPAPNEKLVTPENAIKALVYFAKINDYTIEKEIIDEPGKVAYITGTSPEILLLKVCKIFEIEVNKVTYEDDSVLFQFKKLKKSK
jgi:hypothetical protein